ncbi:MAG: AMP-binding protein [Acidobacteriota bacterium]
MRQPWPQADVLGHRARMTPDATALVVVEPELRLTFAELDARAERCARLWTETLGLEKGDRVGILAHNRVEYLEAFFAAGKTGIVLVTLGTRLTTPELGHVVGDCGPKALMVDGALVSTASPLRDRIEHWIDLDRPSAAGEHAVDYRVATAALDGAPEWRATPCDGEDVYCLLYTSGTTGKPKGVMIPHRQVIWNGFVTACGWQLRSDDVTPIFTPLYHAGGLFAFMVPMVMAGGTVVLHGGFDAAEVWRTFELEGCTVALGVPTIWKLLLEAPEIEEVDLSRVRWLISGGVPLPAYVVEAYQRRGIPFKQGFGMTEAGVNCFAMTVEDSVRKPGSIGRPLMFTEARLVDDDGADVRDDEVGELWLRGPHVCLGYWNNEGATADAFAPGGWLRTGDQARRDADGFFYVAGRRKDMLISGGVNVYPAEIEAVLVRHPGVEDSAVVGVPDSRWGEAGIAFVVRRAGGDGTEEVDANALAAFLGEHLARYKIPKDFRFVDALPRTPYGKVVKGQLRDAYVEEHREGAADDG